MYITVKEATQITGLSRVSIYSYIKKGLIRTDSDSKGTRLNIEDIYKIRKTREEKKS